MHPGTIIKPWQDFTGFQSPATENISYRPLVLLASSFDKGNEKLNRVYGDEFYKMYGSDMNFDKHGQVAIQAAQLIDVGAELLVQRLVADDATLANVVFVATIKKQSVQETDEDGNLLYFDQDDNKVTTVTDKPVMTSESNIVKWEAVSIENCKTMEEIKEAALALYNPDAGVATLVEDGETTGDASTGGTDTEGTVPEGGEEGSKDPENGETEGGTTGGDNNKEETNLGGEEPPVVEDPPKEDDTTGTETEETVVKYPLIIIADNGRGVSIKKVRITADYETSKGSARMFYTLRVFEGTTETEKFTMTLDPDVVYINQAYGLTEDSSVQLQTYVDPDIFAAYAQAIADINMLPVENIRTYDLINMKTNRGVAMEGFEVDPESVDIDASYGVALVEGDNGSFGDTPVTSTALADKMIDFYLGKINNEIFDRDTHKICAVFDANLPMNVKEAIAKLAAFRQDFFYFRDLGLGLTTYSDIVTAIGDCKTNNQFVANYMTSYQIRDPRTKKRIPVTMMYDFAPAMVRLFITGCHVPAAGYINGMIMTSAIEGTINFIPRETMEVNQLDLMEELKVNYAIFEEGNCVVQSEYTCHDQSSQLSYVNNVLAVQQVLRAVRTFCPKHRFSFVTSNDFTEYAEAVNRVLKPYRNNFSILRFDYMSDNTKAQQKIFYGVIYAAFNGWAQTEVFDVYIINSEDQIVQA